MKHVTNDGYDDFSDARQQPTPKGSAQPVEEKLINDDGSSHVEHREHDTPKHSESSQERQAELVAAINTIRSASEPELDAISSEQDLMVKSLMHASYSGALPHPSIFYEYDEVVRERMQRWNDAGTIDESKRQDKLVNAEIAQARSGANKSFILILVSILLSAFLFWLTREPSSMLLLSVPICSVIANLFRPVNSRSSRNNE